MVFRARWLGVYAFITFLGLLASAAAEGPPVLFAAKATPKIDGRIDEVWSATPAVDVARAVKDLLTMDVDQAAKAKVRLLWDEQHLYGLYEVRDAKLSAANDADWEQDSVELFLDENLGRTDTYQPDDAQYRVNYKGRTSGGGNYRVENVDAAVVETDDGYVVELKIKWATLTPKEGDQVGLELQVNDDPAVGARKAILKWADVTDSAWRDTSLFGILTLKNKVPKSNFAEVANAQRNLAASEDESTSVTRDAAPRDDAQHTTSVPAWAKDAVFYQIFPERFRNGDISNDPTRESLEFPDIVPDSWKITPWTSDWYARADWERKLGDNFYEDGVFHRRYGGDLQGVIDKLDYIADLGVNAIYFNPVFYARSLHKYDGNSFHHVDPYFGPDPTGDLALMQRESSDPQSWQWTAADRLFLKLIRKAHSREIRIVIDGVFNHTGRDFSRLKICGNDKTSHRTSPGTSSSPMTTRRRRKMNSSISAGGASIRFPSLPTTRMAAISTTGPSSTFSMPPGAGCSRSLMASRSTASTAGGWMLPTKFPTAFGANGIRPSANWIRKPIPWPKSGTMQATTSATAAFPPR